MILKIRTEGDPVLRQKAAPVRTIDDRMRQLAADMLETMYAAPGVGLAAPQIGESLRLVVLDDGDGPQILFNPVVVQARGHVDDDEGCLSVPKMVGTVSRATDVVVTAQDRRGVPIRVLGTGFLAKILQHEIDHLDGVLYIDKASNVRPVQDDADEEEC